MATVTINKKEYKDLLEKKIRYERLIEAMKEDIFSPPPIRSRKVVLKALRDTKKYNPAFLRSLGKGFKRSSYFKA